MDHFALSAQAIGFVGDFMGTAPQDVTSNNLVNLIAQRLDQSEAGAQALQRLREQPGNQNRRIAASGVLAELAESDPQFAEQLFHAVQQATGTMEFSTVHNQTGNKRPLMIALATLGVIGALILISVILVQALGDSDKNRAEAVAVQFAQALLLGDTETVCALLASNADPNFQELVCDARDRIDPQPEMIESLSVDLVEMTSDTTARVIISAAEEGERGGLDVVLVQEGGRWKIFSASGSDEVS